MQLWVYGFAQLPKEALGGMNEYGSIEDIQLGDRPNPYLYKSLFGALHDHHICIIERGSREVDHLRCRRIRARTRR